MDAVLETAALPLSYTRIFIRDYLYRDASGVNMTGGGAGSRSPDAAMRPTPLPTVAGAPVRLLLLVVHAAVLRFLFRRAAVSLSGSAPR